MVTRSSILVSPLEDPRLQLRSTSIHRLVDRRLSCVVPGVAAGQGINIKYIEEIVISTKCKQYSCAFGSNASIDEPVDLGVSGDDAESDNNYWQVLINECGVRWV